MSQTKVSEFRKAAGSAKAAADLIEAELKCSFSKAEKIAAGRYTSRISAAELSLLNALMMRVIASKKVIVTHRSEEAS